MLVSAQILNIWSRGVGPENFFTHQCISKRAVQPSSKSRMDRTSISKQTNSNLNRESPTQFENRIKSRMYVRRITHSSMYEKSPLLLAGTGVRKISSLACWFSPIKINFSDYPKSLISKKMQLMYVSIKYRYSNISLKKHKLISIFY